MRGDEGGGKVLKGDIFRELVEGNIFCLGVWGRIYDVPGGGSENDAVISHLMAERIIRKEIIFLKA